MTERDIGALTARLDMACALLKIGGETITDLVRERNGLETEVDRLTAELAAANELAARLTAGLTEANELIDDMLEAEQERLEPASGGES